MPPDQSSPIQPGLPNQRPIPEGVRPEQAQGLVNAPEQTTPLVPENESVSIVGESQPVSAQTPEMGPATEGPEVSDPEVAGPATATTLPIESSLQPPVERIDQAEIAKVEAAIEHKATPVIETDTNILLKAEHSEPANLISEMEKRRAEALAKAGFGSVPGNKEEGKAA